MKAYDSSTSSLVIFPARILPGFVDGGFDQGSDGPIVGIVCVNLESCSEILLRLIKMPALEM